MGIVSKPLNSVRETLRIRIQSSVGITIVSHPTIINIDHLSLRLIAKWYIISIFNPPIISKMINHVDEQILGNAILRVILAINIAAELLPLHPTLQMINKTHNSPSEELKQDHYPGQRPQQRQRKVQLLSYQRKK